MTAQNTLGVSSVAEVPSDFVGEQLDAVLSDIRPAATKTGMLLTLEAIEVVAKKAKEYDVQNLVVDPVMISTSGATLMQPAAKAIFRRALVPLAFLLTPNISEARELTGSDVQTVDDMERAALQIHQMGAKHVLIKGGHLDAADAVDVFFDGEEFSHFQSPRIATRHTHGTGCVLSAALAAFLAQGKPVKEAVRLGKEFVTNAIKGSLAIGNGSGPCNPLAC
jgi:hydroxymethylpyrimidine kinase/phosphomethylpyrimidine kinase